MNVETPLDRQARAAAHHDDLARQGQAAVQYAAARGSLSRRDIPAAVAHLVKASQRMAATS